MSNINQMVQQFLQRCDVFEKQFKMQFENMSMELMDPIFKLEMQMANLYKRQNVSSQLSNLLEQLQLQVEKNMSLIQSELSEITKQVRILIKHNSERVQLIEQQFRVITYEKLPEIKFSYNFSSLEEKQVEAHKKFKILQLEFEKKSGLIISSSEDSNIFVWDMRTLSQKQKLQGHQSWVRQIRLIQQEEKTYLISGGDDRQVIVWSKYGKRFIREKSIEFTNVTTYIRAMEGGILNDNPIAILGTGRNEGFCLIVLCLISERKLQRIKQHENTISVVKIVKQHADRLEVLSCDVDGVNILWQIAQQNAYVVHKWRCRKNDYMTYCDVSKELIVFGQSEGIVQVYWNRLVNSRLNCIYEYQFGSESILGVRFIDENRICVINGQRFVEILELEKKNVVRLVLKSGMNQRITSLGLNQDDGMIAIGDSFGKLYRICYEKKI